jgi:hypothetical protein
MMTYYVRCEWENCQSRATYLTPIEMWEKILIQNLTLEHKRNLPFVARK